MDNLGNTSWLSVGKSFKLATSLIKQDKCEPVEPIHENPNNDRKNEERGKSKEERKHNKKEKKDKKDKKEKHGKDHHKHKKSKKSHDRVDSLVSKQRSLEETKVARTSNDDDYEDDDSFASSSDEEDEYLQRLKLIAAKNPNKEVTYLPNGEVILLDKSLSTENKTISWQLDYHADEDIPYMLGYNPYSAYDAIIDPNQSMVVSHTKVPSPEEQSHRKSRYFSRGNIRILMNPNEPYYRLVSHPLESSSTSYGVNGSYSGLLPLPILDHAIWGHTLPSTSSSTTTATHPITSTISSSRTSYITNVLEEINAQQYAFLHSFPSQLIHSPDNLTLLLDYIIIQPMMIHYFQSFASNKSLYSYYKQCLMGFTTHHYHNNSLNTLENVLYYLTNAVDYYANKVENVSEVNDRIQQEKMKKKYMLLQELYWCYGGGLITTTTNTTGPTANTIHKKKEKQKKAAILSLDQCIQSYPLYTPFLSVWLQHYVSILFTQTSNNNGNNNGNGSDGSGNVVMQHMQSFLQSYISWIKNDFYIRSFTNNTQQQSAVIENAKEEEEEYEHCLEIGYINQLNQWSLYLSLLFHAFNQREQCIAIIQAMMMLQMHPQQQQTAAAVVVPLLTRCPTTITTLTTGLSSATTTKKSIVAGSKTPTINNEARLLALSTQWDEEGPRIGEAQYASSSAVSYIKQHEGCSGVLDRQGMLQTIGNKIALIESIFPNTSNTSSSTNRNNDSSESQQETERIDDNNLTGKQAEEPITKAMGEAAEEEHPDGAKLVYSRVHGYKIWMYPEDTTYLYKKILSDIDLQTLPNNAENEIDEDDDAENDESDDEHAVDGNQEGHTTRDDDKERASTASKRKSSSELLNMNTIDQYRQSYYTDYWLQSLQTMPLKSTACDNINGDEEENNEEEGKSYLLALEEQPERVIFFQDIQSYLFALPTRKVIKHLHKHNTIQHIPAPPLPPTTAHHRTIPSVPSLSMLTITTQTIQETNYETVQVEHMIHLMYHSLMTLGLTLPWYSNGHNSNEQDNVQFQKAFYQFTNFHTLDDWQMAWQAEFMQYYHQQQEISKDDQMISLVENMFFMSLFATTFSSDEEMFPAIPTMRSSGFYPIHIESIVLKEYLLSLTAVDQEVTSESKGYSKVIGNGSRLIYMIYFVQQSMEYFTVLYTHMIETINTNNVSEDAAAEGDEVVVEWDEQAIHSIKQVLSDLRNVLISLLIVKTRIDDWHRFHQLTPPMHSTADPEEELRQAIRNIIQLSLLLPATPSQPSSSCSSVSSTVGDLSNWISYLYYEAHIGMKQYHAIKNPHALQVYYKLSEKVFQAIDSQVQQLVGISSAPTATISSKKSLPIEHVSSLYWHTCRVLLGMLPYQSMQANNPEHPVEYSKQFVRPMHRIEAEALLIQFAFRFLNTSNTTLARYDHILSGLASPITNNSKSSKSKKKSNLYVYYTMEEKEKRQYQQQAIQEGFQQYILEYAQVCYTQLTTPLPASASSTASISCAVDSTSSEILHIVNMMAWLSYLITPNNDSSATSSPAVAETIMRGNLVYITTMELFRSILLSSSTTATNTADSTSSTSSSSCFTDLLNTWHTFSFTQTTLSQALHATLHPTPSSTRQSLSKLLALGDLVLSTPLHHTLYTLLHRLAYDQMEFLFYTSGSVSNLPCYHEYLMSSLLPIVQDYPSDVTFHALVIHSQSLYHHHQNNDDAGYRVLLSYYHSHSSCTHLVPSQIIPLLSPSNPSNGGILSDCWIIPTNITINTTQTMYSAYFSSLRLYIEFIHILSTLSSSSSSSSPASITPPTAVGIAGEVDWQYFFFTVLHLSDWSITQYEHICYLFEQQILLPTTTNLPTTSNNNSNDNTNTAGGYANESVAIGCVWLWRCYYFLVALYPHHHHRDNEHDDKEDDNQQTRGTKKQKKMKHKRKSSRSQVAASSAAAVTSRLQIAKKIFLRGLVVCGWCKDYYLDVLGILRPVFQEKEIQSMLMIMENLQIPLRC